MDEPIVRILAVDDYKPWRVFVASMLQKQPKLRIIAIRDRAPDVVADLLHHAVGQIVGEIDPAAIGRP